MNRGDDFLRQAMEAGLSHYVEAKEHLVDLVAGPPQLCRGCGKLIFSRWMFADEHNVSIEIWAAIALGFERLPDDAEAGAYYTEKTPDGVWAKEPEWLCDVCHHTLDEL